MKTFGMCISLLLMSVCCLIGGRLLADEHELDDFMTDEFKEFLALGWEEGGTHWLSQSNSKLSVPEEYFVLLDEAAKKCNELCGNGSGETIEAVVSDFSSIIYFDYIPSGYISTDDWSKIDPKQLLDSISKNAEVENKRRIASGFDELHVIGWIQEPVLDRHTNTVFWAIELLEGDSQIVNSTALRLGRRGFERIVWVADRNEYVPFGGELDIMLRSHSFEPGSRYGDYVPGDKAAAYGIAGLVVATIGGKFGKVAIVGGLAFLKKFSGIILAGLAGLGYKIKNIFSSN